LTTNQLIINILKRVGKLKFIILIGGILFGYLGFLFAKKSPTIYLAKSSVYPLTSGQDKSSTTNKLTELIGGTTGGKSLSEEANVNIEEVAKSRKTREAVVAEKVAEFDNKLLAEILIDEFNKNAGFFTKKIKKPTSREELIVEGGTVFKDTYIAKFNKQNLLEITYSNRNEKLITPVSNFLVAKISEFYKELKIKKASFDYEFTLKKVDSLQRVLNEIDAKIISMNERSLFIRNNKLKYVIPMENLENEKLQVLAQKNSAVANAEDAHWRLEKVTPIIEILDKAVPPFDITKPSKKIYTIIGFFVGCLFFTFIFVSGLLYKYSKYTITNFISNSLKDEDLPIVENTK
jgi:uncharacterized protein involved in exopolysaccharide biosynthesis